MASNDAEKREHRVRVMIVDANGAYRAGLKFFLLAYEDLELVGEAVSGEEAIHMCTTGHPDVVLIAEQMPGMGGVYAANVIRQRWPNVQVIAMTSLDTAVRGYPAWNPAKVIHVSKDVSANELHAAICRAYRGPSATG